MEESFRSSPHPSHLFTISSLLQKRGQDSDCYFYIGEARGWLETTGGSLGAVGAKVPQKHGALCLGKGSSQECHIPHNYIAQLLPPANVLALREPGEQSAVPRMSSSPCIMQKG